MDFKKEYLLMQERIKKYRKLEHEINKAKEKLSKAIGKRYIYNGEECYVSWINYEHDSISLSPTGYIGTRLDYLVVKKFTFEEFYDEYLIEKD